MSRRIIPFVQPTTPSPELAPSAPAGSNSTVSKPGPNGSNPAEPKAHISPSFDTIETAAAKLAVPPNALRTRCRKAVKAAGNALVAQLGGGIVAFRFGGTWRIYIPQF